MTRLLENLTEPQREAVTHAEGPLLILAGPGSGKTRVITHRIAWLLEQGAPPHQILALTFTNKAAAEMRHRVATLAPGAVVWTSTFHRFCARLLRDHARLVGLDENFTILDAEDSRKALRRAMENIRLDLSLFPPERIVHEISNAKNRLLRPEDYDGWQGSPVAHLVSRAYPAYQAHLQAANVVDFDDLLMYSALLLRDNPELRARRDERHRYIMVDEYQDTNAAQYALVRALSIDHPNLAVTGDPDQSIYSWRGANLGNILDFERDFPGVRVVRLEQNYRSTQRILSVAARLISYNRFRKEKALFTENAAGAPVRLTAFATQRDEADDIAARIAADVRAGRRRLSDFAVFYRTNALSRALEHALRERGLRYQMVHGVEFYQRREVKDLLAYLDLLNNPRNEVAFLRVVNTPPRGIGKSTIARIVDYAAARRLAPLAAARESGLIDGLPKRAAVAVAKFVAMYDELASLAAGPVEEILGTVLARSGYREYLQDSGSEEDEQRLANIEELLTAARQFDENFFGDGALEQFLEEASLVNDTDAWSENDDSVTLMTLHASKGLEFPVVFVVALEEGLIPHQRSTESPQEYEEERRLLFVGITRAKEELHLSWARYRDFRGQRRLTIPSPFMLEFPRDEMDLDDLGWRGTAASAAGKGGDYGDVQFEDGIPSTHSGDHVDEAIEFDIHALERAANPSSVGPTSREAHVAAEFEDEPSLRHRKDWRAAGAAAADRADTPQSLASLSTAAELAARQAGKAAAEVALAAPRVPVEVFVQDMIVAHPRYGQGKIVALSGGGGGRVATVQFEAAEAGKKKFVLAKSPLVPAGKS
ncbi:MAG: UvrD-helicase domain-containing protein [Pirellulales bacterium]|nr:UvrD-helicase domain-containing protein [Pirellulales bacterium]